MLSKCTQRQCKYSESAPLGMSWEQGAVEDEVEVSIHEALERLWCSLQPKRELEETEQW